MMTTHIQHMAAKLAALVTGFAALFGAALVDLTSTSIDVQTLMTYAAGLLGTGGLFWRVWAVVSSTVRADDVQNKRIADMQTRLDDIEADRDYYRDLVLKPKQIE